MAKDETDELLSQDDIDAALNTEGAANKSGAAASGGKSASAPKAKAEPAAEGGLAQAGIDAAPAAAGTAENGSGADAPPADAPEPEPAAAQEDARVDSAGRPFDEVAAAMAAAIEAESDAPSSSEPAAPGAAAVSPYAIPQLDSDNEGGAVTHGIELLRDVELNVKIELGRSRMLVEDVLRLGEGSVVELDKLAGDPVDVFVNNRLVARGEVLVLNDSFCVRINDIVSREFGEED